MLLDILNKELVKIFESMNYNVEFAFFNYSDRPDLSDFQTNASMSLAKVLKKNPREIAEQIANELNKISFFEKISVDGPGFINIIVKNEFLFDNINKPQIKKESSKNVLLEYLSPNVAKEMHVGHLKNAILGGSLERIYKFAGDKVRTDNHLGDWGTNMGMVIEAIKTKYPYIDCFKEGFNKDKITDLNLTPLDLLELYQFSNAKAKEDKEYFARVLENTRLLQQKYKPYYVLWQYFSDVSINDMNDICKILNIGFDTIYGESFYEDLCIEIVDELKKNGKATISQELLVIDLQKEGFETPFLLAKSNGSFLYSTTDLATIKFRTKEYNDDLTLYVVDFRQSLHFKQLFATAQKVGYINEGKIFKHIGYGTMNGKDNKPYKTRSGDVVKIRDLLNETIEIISKKATIKDESVIKNIAIACLKFADLVNFRESSYVFDMEQFTNFEGKTGAYILYSIVRINSILANHKNIDNLKLQSVKTKNERDLLFELTKFSEVFKLAYNKNAPHFIAEYTYNIAKKFNAFYVESPINNEMDEIYKNTKLKICILVKEYLQTCLTLLNIDYVEKM